MAISQLEVSPDAASGLVAEARRLLTLAVESHRDEQLVRALDELDDLYAQAYAIEEKGVAVREQRLIIKARAQLLGLYGLRGPGESPPDDESLRDLEAIRGHLEPLALAPEDTDAAELARLAAAEVCRLRAAQVVEPAPNETEDDD